jgi:hypothetical protein
MKWETAKKQIKTWGFFPFLYDGVMSRVRPWFMLCELQHRHHTRREEPYPLADNREVRIATREDLAAAAMDPESDIKAKWLEQALKRGEICAAVFEDGRVLSYVWRAFGPTPHEKDVWVEFDPKYSYSFKTFTRPDCRQQRLNHVVNYAMDCHLLDRGHEDCLIFVETHNYPSLIGAHKRGNRPVGYAGYLRLFGRVFCFRSPGAKRHGFRFFHVPAESSLRLGQSAKPAE